MEPAIDHHTSLQEEPTSSNSRTSYFLEGVTGNSYEILNAISEGSYGMVYRARNIKTGRIVAVKHEFDGASESTFREVRILESLPRHPSIVELKDTIAHYDSDHVFVVMEYLKSDLNSFIKSSGATFTLTKIKWVMKRILEGVAFLHENRVMHRDLKPSNILIDENKGKLKICDYGLSRFFNKASGLYSPKVGTLWYRAPELLINATEYSCTVDMWSVGCILGELLTEEVLFRGSSQIEQLASIFKVLGTPNDVTWPGFSSLPESMLFVYQPDNLLGLKLAPSMVTTCGLDLINKLLTYDPSKRITARAALNHGWFKENEDFKLIDYRCLNWDILRKVGFNTLFAMVKPIYHGIRASRRCLSFGDDVACGSDLFDLASSE